MVINLCYVAQNDYWTWCCFGLLHSCLIAEPGECLEGSVHLADGGISQEGRVEVCLGGVWGSVCGDGWDQMDAYILCEQLDLGEGGQDNRV